MNLADIRAELEEELTWRLEELRFFKNQLADFRKEDERDRYRRAMVVMLYAHFEGFWKAAFVIYLKAVNSFGLRCAEANEALVAAAFFEVFEALADANRKSDFFRNAAPDDSKLHRFSRQREFAGRVGEFARKTMSIEPESIVDTESNLKPVVIRKNLFRLGFKHDSFKVHDGTIDWLLNWRNEIAHGARRNGLTEEQYVPLEVAVYDVMRAVVQFIFDALRERRFLRSPESEYEI